MHLLPALLAVVAAAPVPTLEGTPLFDVYPRITTAYRVRWSGRTSRTLTVRVRPDVVLRPDGRGRFVVSITATRDFDGRTALLERLDRRTGR